MSYNPWKVENIQSFVFLNCPECEFKTKKKSYFQEHAAKKHPMSCVFFEDKIKCGDELSDNFIEQDCAFMEEDETLEELMFSDDVKIDNDEKFSDKQDIFKRKRPSISI